MYMHHGSQQLRFQHIMLTSLTAKRPAASASATQLEELVPQ